MICAAEVSPAATGDAVVAPTLVGDLVPGQGEQTTRAVVYGDAAYGTGAHLAWLDQQGLTPMVKTQLPTAPGGRFAKDQFQVDLAAGTVTCPARVTTPIVAASRGGGRARFGAACSVCPLREACTTSVRGRVVGVHPTRPPSPPPAPASAIPPGGPTIERPGPRSSASSPTCSAAATAADTPACGAWSEWPKTSSCWPRRSTWPGSPPSGCAPRPMAGRSSRPDQPASQPQPGGAQPAEHAQAVREQRPPSPYLRRPHDSVIGTVMDSVPGRAGWLPPCERVGGKRHANLCLRSSRRTVRREVRWREVGDFLVGLRSPGPLAPSLPWIGSQAPY